MNRPKGKDEDNMGQEAKIKAATKAFRAGDTAEAAIHAAKIHGRTLRRLTDRACPPVKRPLPTIEFVRA